MAVRFGSGADRVPPWAFAVVGFVLVVGLFFGIRGVASPGGGARGGGGGSPDGGISSDTSTGTSTGGGGADTSGGSGSGGSGGGDTAGGTSGGGTDGGTGGTGGSSSGSWQTGGSDGGDGGAAGAGGGGDGGGGGGNRGGGTPPGWLPWGPKSPNTDDAPEPDSMYDLLQRGECQLPYDSATDPEKRPDNSATPQAWKVIEGLAGICKAAHGERTGLAIAIRAEAGLRAAGYRPGTSEYLCKDGDAFAVLRRFVAYYRRHPAEQVALRSAPAGTAACGNKIAATERSVAPGESVGLYGTWPDVPRTVELRAAELREPLVLTPYGDENAREKCCKDGTVTVDLPGPDGFGGRRPTVIDVTLVTKNGARVTRRAAFTITWAGIPQPPAPPLSSRSPVPTATPTPAP
ncbi:hypothetical protein DEJ49_34330 [Streptomyces venezuelae]|uniref:Uncharacterized protein n=1 Tax=Streptomyces venezuelae TaxID=54571 RepID=A0A5P2CSK9_STRVZ|nr:hypothetical protein [Streptomyces venezuelae]QES45403.1 hypothetical protein DEJ49_34330 [Streptomyces venezuelae]